MQNFKKINIKNLDIVESISEIGEDVPRSKSWMSWCWLLTVASFAKVPNLHVVVRPIYWHINIFYTISVYSSTCSDILVITFSSYQSLNTYHRDLFVTALQKTWLYKYILNSQCIKLKHKRNQVKTLWCQEHFLH